MEITATPENFKDILSSPRPVMVDFWAVWCGPCRMLSPVVEGIAAKYDGKVDVVKCNINECENLAMQFGIRSIPTLMFFKNGEMVHRIVGLVSASEIEEVLNGLL